MFNNLIEGEKDCAIKLAKPLKILHLRKSIFYVYLIKLNNFLLKWNQKDVSLNVRGRGLRLAIKDAFWNV